MFNKLRNYSKFIIVIIVVAMVITGIFYGVGMFSNVNMSDFEIAEVNGKNILQQEYFSYLGDHLRYTQLTRAQEVPFKYQILNSLINTELVLQEADKLGIKEEVTEEDVDGFLNQYLTDYQITEDELKNELEINNKNITDFRKEIKAMLGPNSRIEQVQKLTYADLTVTEEEIINDYEEIELQVIEKGFADDKEKAEQSISEALEKINDGSNFAEIAEEYSDFYRVELGMFTREDSLLPTDITEKAFSLEKDQLSEIIEGENSYYLIKVLDKKLAVGEEYEHAKEEIRENLLATKQEEAFTEWLLNLRKESEIIINDPILSGYHGLANGDYEFAASELEKALEAGYVSPMTYVYLSQAYMSNEQTDKALETYDKAIENYPEDWELYYNYGMLLFTMEEPDQEKAVSMLDSASISAGDDIMAHYQLYMAYLQIDESEKAQLERDKMNEINENIQRQQEELTQGSEEENNNDPELSDTEANDSLGNEE